MSSGLKNHLGLVCAIAGVVLGSLSSHADDAIVNVVDQAKYQMAAKGIRSGSIIFTPGISATELYDDNVYSTENNTESDMITVIRPALGVVTDFDVHALYLSTSGSFGRYQDNGTEDYDDYTISGGGRLDLDYKTYLTLSSTHKSAHEDRGSPDDPNADEPVQYSLTTYKSEFNRSLGLIKLYVRGLYDKFKFEDAALNGITIDNSGRDRDIYTAYTKLSYEYSPGYNIYTSVRYDWRRYDKKGLLSRDSEGSEFQLGTDLDITGKMRGDIYVGYLMREYEADRPSIDALSYGGSLIWNLTGLTSLTAEASRAVEETTFQDASGELQTRFGLNLDHALRYNLFLQGNVAMTLSDFEQTTADKREDKNYSAGLAVEYMPFEGTSVKLGYQHVQRDSSLDGEDNQVNRLMLTLSKSF